MSTSWWMPVSPACRLQRALQASHHLARSLPTAGLVHEARAGWSPPPRGPPQVRSATWPFHAAGRRPHAPRRRSCRGRPPSIVFCASVVRHRHALRFDSSLLSRRNPDEALPPYSAQPRRFERCNLSSTVDFALLKRQPETDDQAHRGGNDRDQIKLHRKPQPRWSPNRRQSAAKYPPAEDRSASGTGQSGERLRRPSAASSRTHRGYATPSMLPGDCALNENFALCESEAPTRGAFTGLDSAFVPSPDSPVLIPRSG